VTWQRRWRFGAALAGATAALITSWAGCGEGGGGEPGQPAEVVRYTSWEAFTQARVREGAGARRQVVVIGLDAAPWHYVDRLIAEGRMPNLARILREGARATLRSVETQVTPPAWTALFTGYRPERSGVYSFGYWDPASEDFPSANGDDVEVPFVWEAASRAGLEVAVANVPMTYPVRPVNGIMVSGMMTEVEILLPLETTAFKPPADWFRRAPSVRNFSPPLSGSVADSLTAFLWVFHDTTDDGARRYDTAALRVLSREGGRAPRELAFHVGPTASYTPWLPVRCRHEGVVVDGWVRAYLDMLEGGRYRFTLSRTVLPIAVPYTHPPELANELGDRFGFYLPSKFLDTDITPQLTRDMAGYASFFYDYGDWDLYAFVFTQTDNIHHFAGFSDKAAEVYAICDSLIGAIMARMPEDGVLVVASDHGSKAYDVGIDLNRVFEGMGLLACHEPGRIDYAHTLVFHNLWEVFLNRKTVTREALAARGIDVPPGVDPVETLTDHVQRALAELRAPDGTPFPIETSRPPVDAANRAPDLIVHGAGDGYCVRFWSLLAPDREPFVRLEGRQRFWHQRDGILALWGGPVRRGVDIGAREIADVAPTILYLLGLPVAPDMHGRVIADAFEARFTRETPLCVNDGYLDLPRAPVARDRGERESLEKKLRSLGYIR